MKGLVYLLSMEKNQRMYGHICTFMLAELVHKHIFVLFTQYTRVFMF